MPARAPASACERRTEREARSDTSNIEHRTSHGSAKPRHERRSASVPQAPAAEGPGPLEGRAVTPLTASAPDVAAVNPTAISVKRAETPADPQVYRSTSVPPDPQVHRSTAVLLHRRPPALEPEDAFAASDQNPSTDPLIPREAAPLSVPLLASIAMPTHSLACSKRRPIAILRPWARSRSIVAVERSPSPNTSS